MTNPTSPATIARADERRHTTRDAQVNALRGAPIHQTDRTLLNTWRARMTRQKHGGLSW
ncbi:hypothetical protein SAMN05216467_2880 [Cellulomonas sp. KH9]|nr:hypothetical protein SAMN05216467_2880 [Cellulomonas sp. KH9]